MALVVNQPVQSKMYIYTVNWLNILNWKDYLSTPKYLAIQGNGQTNSCANTTKFMVSNCDSKQVHHQFVISRMMSFRHWYMAQSEIAVLRDWLPSQMVFSIYQTNWSVSWLHGWYTIRPQNHRLNWYIHIYISFDRCTSAWLTVINYADWNFSNLLQSVLLLPFRLTESRDVCVCVCVYVCCQTDFIAFMNLSSGNKVV